MYKKLISQIKELQYRDIEVMYKKCIELKQKALESHDYYALCLASNYITDYYYSVKTHQEALMMARENLTINEEYQIEEQLMIAHNLFGVIICNDDLPLAVSHYLSALKFAQKQEDHSMLFRVYSNIGDIFVNLEDYHNALIFCSKGLEEIEKINHDHPTYSLKRYILLYIADIYYELGYHDKCQSLLLEVNDLFSNDPNDSMNYLYASIWVKVYYHNGDINKAIDTIDLLITHPIKGFRSNEIIYVVYRRIFKILLELKDLNRIETVLNILRDNDFIQSGNKYQLEFLQMRIDANIMINDQESLQEIYKTYYELSVADKKNTRDLNLNSILNHIELYKTIQEKETMTKLSHIDDLTSLYNRRIFKDDFLETKKKSHTIGILIFDLDKFKQYNDSYGHIKGDKLLVDFSATLLQDNAHIVPYRFGGDEFMCLCHDITKKEIISYIENVFIQFDNMNYREITISCGYYYVLNHKNLEHKELIEHADQYLYQVKRNGKNGYYGYIENG